MTLGQSVRLRLAELGLTRRELEQQSGISYAYICEIITGAKDPSLTVLRALADTLGLSASQLLDGPKITWGRPPNDWWPVKCARCGAEEWEQGKPLLHDPTCRYAL